MWYQEYHVVSFDSVVRACMRIFDGTFTAIFTDGRSNFLRMFLVSVLFLFGMALFQYLIKKWR